MQLSRQQITLVACLAGLFGLLGLILYPTIARDPRGARYTLATVTGVAAVLAYYLLAKRLVPGHPARGAAFACGYSILFGLVVLGMIAVNGSPFKSSAPDPSDLPTITQDLIIRVNKPRNRVNTDVVMAIVLGAGWIVPAAYPLVLSLKKPVRAADR